MRELVWKEDVICVFRIQYFLHVPNVSCALNERSCAVVLGNLDAKGLDPGLVCPSEHLQIPNSVNLHLVNETKGRAGDHYRVNIVMEDLELCIPRSIMSWGIFQEPFNNTIFLSLKN
jgi:hypothetical protein